MILIIRGYNDNTNYAIIIFIDRQCFQTNVNYKSRDAKLTLPLFLNIIYMLYNSTIHRASTMSLQHFWTELLSRPVH